MIYIISGTQDEAERYIKEKKIETTIKASGTQARFVPDSSDSLDCKETASIIFIGSFKNRKDILDRLMESRDLLLAKIASLEKQLVYDDDGNLVTQADFNRLVSELIMYREYVK